MVKSKIFKLKRFFANDNGSGVGGKPISAKKADKILKDIECKSQKIAIIVNALRHNQGAVTPLPDCVWDGEDGGKDGADGLEKAWDLIIELKKKKLVARDSEGVMRVDLLVAFYCGGRSDEEVAKWLRKRV